MSTNAANISESTFTLRDGLEVYTKTFHPPHTVPPVAQLVFLHGFSDHINTYHTTPPLLASRGLLFSSFDQRGFGRTSPQKSDWGNTGPTEQILSDLDDFLSHCLTTHPNLPCFLVGHSMGGGIALTYAYRGSHRDRLAGVIVWSPFLALAGESKPLWVVKEAGKLLAKIAPKRQMLNPLDASYMSRDPEICREFEEDPLCHDTGTLQGLAGMLDRGDRLMEKRTGGLFDRGLRLLVCHGTGDKVTAWEASKHFVEGVSCEDKVFRPYEGWYHKMHEEPGELKELFANDLADWILKRIPAANGDVNARL